jgi:hypothetical protein
MKSFFKLLGIISFALVIGFGLAGCETDDDGDKKDDKKGGGPNFPAELMFKSTTFGDRGGWGTRSGGSIIFQGGYSDALGWNKARVSFNQAGWTADNDTMYDLVSVEGKKITIQEKTSGSQPIILCTDYTLAGDILTLTGTAAATSFSVKVQGIYAQITAPLPKMANNEF